MVDHLQGGHMHGTCMVDHALSPRPPKSAHLGPAAQHRLCDTLYTPCGVMTSESDLTIQVKGKVLIRMLGDFVI